MKKLIATAISIVASATLLASNAGAYYGSTPYYVDIPTQDEIIEKYYELGMDKPYKTEYAQTPSTSYPFSAGALTDVSLQQALNTVNFIRFTAGIDEVSLDEGYCNLAQHASLVNAVNGSLSHSPSQPADMPDDIYQLGAQGAGSSNIAMGYGNLPSSIINGYMEDSDPGNIQMVGHRRWILHPCMKKTGFGKVGSYSAMYAFDGSFTGYLASDYLAWPAQNMPYELYSPYYGIGYAFSVTLGNSYDTPSLDDVKVTVTSQLQNKTWTLDSTDTNTRGEYLNVNNSYYGLAKCIIFNVGTFENNDVVTVRIDGIYKNGVESPITYDVNFFSVVKLYGDVNDDGDVDIRDVVLLYQRASGRNVSLNTSNADVNGDGQINIRDVVLLYQHASGWDVELG